MIENTLPASEPTIVPTSNSYYKESIPDIVIGRLPIYLRTLEQLANAGQEVTSSQELGVRLGISSAQIRKDLSHFGEFGKQGTGYNIAYLCKQLSIILRVDRIWPIVLVGAGYLGHALTNYDGFENRGFRIVAVFDSDETKVGTKVGELKVEPFSAAADIIEENKCQIATLAVPAHAAQGVADILIKAGIRSLLCYAPITLNAPPHVRVEYIDPLIYFQHMTFYLEHPDDDKGSDSANVNTPHGVVSADDASVVDEASDSE